MSLAALGALVLAIAAMGGIVWLAMRLSKRTYDRLRERVETTRAVFQTVAGTAGLAYRPMEDYAHAIIGQVPSFPRLAGARGGFTVHVEVHTEAAGEGGAICTTRVAVHKPTGAPWPSLGRLRRADREDRISADAVAALRTLEPHVHRVTLEYGVLSADAKGDRTGTGLSFEYDLVLDPTALVALLDDLVALASRLG